MTEAVVKYLDTHRNDLLEDWKTLLRIPSVSADPAHAGDMRAAATWVRDKLASAGLAAEVVATEGHPLIYAEWLGAPGEPTVLIYGHYDVQPADPFDLWTSPPFEPTERGGALYARGATDDKGQMLTHVQSVAAWLKATGSLPVNVKFVIEGEEEVGSNNLDKFLEENKERLKSDVAVVSDTSQYGPGIPAITYGLRGILACEFTVHGPDRDLHSGVFGGSVANPCTGAARIIASLHDDESRVLIPGFYDGVVPLLDSERAQFAALPFSEADYLAGLGASAAVGEAGFTTLERRWARPTCEINGLFGGYSGPGPKTIVPAKATAKITCRLVPDQDPEKLTKALEDHVRRVCPPGLRLEFKSYHGCPAFVFDPNSPYLTAAGNAVERAFGKRPVLIREGGSIPVVATFKHLLGLDTLLLGWGQNTDNLHSPDEHFRIEDYHRGTLASALLWAELAAM